jgi:hypothetical protein
MGKDADNNPAAPADMSEDCTMSVEEAHAPPIWKPALKEAARAFAAAVVLLSLVYTLAFPQIHPEFARFIGQGATPLTATGKDFIPASIGKGKRAGSQFIIEDFNGDEAILVLPRPFVAEHYPFIKVNLSGFTRYSKAKILWQREGETKTHALEFNRSGSEVTQIAMVYGGEQYAGRINSIALLFYDGPALGFENNADVDIVIDSIQLRPFSTMRVAEQIFEDWTNPPLWQGYSNNIVRGIHANGMVFPNAVANLLVVTGLVITGLVRLGRKWRALSPPAHRLLATALCLCLYGWAFNDVLRWHWRIEQLIDTHERYAGLPIEEKIRNSDVRCARFPEDCAAHLLPYF